MNDTTRAVRVLQMTGNAIVGGMETYVERLVIGLQKRQFQFFCVAPFESRGTSRLRERGCPVQVVKMGEEICWGALQTVCTLISLHDIEVLHAHLPQAHLLAALAGRLTGRPVLATIHGRAVSQFELEIHRLATTHMSVVHRTAWLHAIAAGVPRGRLSLVPNGVDVAVFQPRLDTDRLRGMLKLGKETLLVGFVGRLSPEKGPDVFVRAAAAMRDAGTDAHFVLIGDGPPRPSLARAAAALRLEHRVHFIGVASDMPALLPALDVVVSTSHSEGLPLAVMEAMACARPVVCTHVGGNADLVEVGTTGFLVPDGDFGAIAECVLRLLADADLCQMFGEAARRRVQHQFNFSRTHARHGPAAAPARETRRCYDQLREARHD